jgi:hypothetical protein
VSGKPTTFGFVTEHNQDSWPVTFETDPFPLRFEPGSYRNGRGNEATGQDHADKAVTPVADRSDALPSPWAALASLTREWEQLTVPSRFRCHPNVMRALQHTDPDPDDQRIGAVGPLFEIPVFVDDTMEPGSWQLLDVDGQVVNEGAIRS